MKKKQGLTREEREKYWTTVIEAARRNPRGVTQYLEEHGISKDFYYQWFARLRGQHPEWKNLAAPGKRRRIAAMEANAGEAATQVFASGGRRRFSAEYKAKILTETDNADGGEISAILRREGLYASHLKNWRTERAETGLAPKKRGRKSNPLTAENKALRAENARLQKRLRQQELLLEFQKKVAEILNSAPIQNPESD